MGNANLPSVRSGIRWRGVLVAVAAMASADVALGAPVTIDRAVVRFDAPETGGIARPQFIFERELAFEARLEALGDPDFGQSGGGYLDRHVRAALERHVAEELLSQLADAAKGEGLDESEVDRLVRREARASLYLDRMVAPMLEPSEAELREVHRSTANPFRGQKFDDVTAALRKWYVGERLEAALG